MFAKSRVAEGVASPLHERIAKAVGEYPMWNFHKYVISADRTLVSSFASSVEPLNSRFIAVIESSLPSPE